MWFVNLNLHSHHSDFILLYYFIAEGFDSCCPLPDFIRVVDQEDRSPRDSAPPFVYIQPGVRLKSSHLNVPRTADDNLLPAIHFYFFTLRSERAIPFPYLHFNPLYK